jgi:glyceraldehyde 3-phosphate dehydrogenase
LPVPFHGKEAPVSVRIGIMGFGRIGRNIFRILHNREDVEVAAIVDIADPQALAYLLRFDTVHGRFPEPVVVKGEFMYVAGRQIRMLTRKEPGEAPWRELGVSIAIESTGKYPYRSQLVKHLEAGAERVILTVPPRDAIDATIVMGVNDHELKPTDRIISNASCTANAVAPVIRILHQAFGIEKAMLTSVHAYTNDQRLADVPHTELRRSRAAAENIIPTTTHTPQVVATMLPALAGRLDGMAMNVPVPDGSIADLVSLLSRPVTVEQVNEVVRSAAAKKYERIIEYAEEPIVSSDIIGNPHSGIFDALSTQVAGDNLVKTLIWYDNGWGYANRVVELIGRLTQMSRN